MGEIWAEIWVSGRRLLKSRAFTACVVMTLALGIGINTAVFSVADAVMFRPLPFASPSELVNVWERDPGQPQYIFAPTLGSLEFWRTQTQIFARVEGYAEISVTVTGATEPESMASLSVTPGLFDALGVVPARGRGFRPEDAQLGSPRVMVISETFWRTRFGGVPDVLGKTLLLNDERYEVIGVMAKGFSFPAHRIQFWIPLLPASRGRVNVLARLHPGLTSEQALAATEVIVPGLAQTRPFNTGPFNLLLNPIEKNRVDKRPRRALLVLLGAVGFVLLLTCANVASLLLARTADRQADIAIRMAMGASRLRIAREELIDCFLLATAGGTLGTLIAWVGVGILTRIVPSELTDLSIAGVGMDLRVLGFSVIATLLTAVVFGLAPAGVAARSDVNRVLGAGSGRASSDRGGLRARGLLVIVQVSVAAVLLMGAGLMMRSFLLLSSESAGFDSANLISVEINLPRHRYSAKESRNDFFIRLKESVSAMPGVQSVSIASGAAPTSGGVFYDTDIQIFGREPEPKGKRVMVPVSYIDEDYFATMKIPVIRGRGFPLPDQLNGESTVIINREMAQRYWPNGDPIGSRFRVRSEEPWSTVVGVVGNVVTGPAGNTYSRMRVHYPLRRDGRFEGALLVRVDGSMEQAFAGIRARIRALDKDQPIGRLETVEGQLDEVLAEPRFYLRLLVCFAVVTQILMAMGIYGLLAQVVAKRTREIGVRMALGAMRAHVLGLVFRRGMALTITGLAVGGAAALALSKTMTAFLFGAPPPDFLSSTLTAALMLVTASAACWIPARRATLVEPAIALRQE